MGRVCPYPYNGGDNTALRWSARSTRCTMSYDVANPDAKFTRLIEFGLVVDTTTPNSIIAETWRDCRLRLIFRKSAPNRIFFSSPDLSLLTGSGRRSWPFPMIFVMVIEVTVQGRGGCRND